MFKSEKEIKDVNVELANIDEVIEYYISTGIRIENEDEVVITSDGLFCYKNKDCVMLKTPI